MNESRRLAALTGEGELPPARPRSTGIASGLAEFFGLATLYFWLCSRARVSFCTRLLVSARYFASGATRSLPGATSTTWPLGCSGAGGSASGGALRPRFDAHCFESMVRRLTGRLTGRFGGGVRVSVVSRMTAPAASGCASSERMKATTARRSEDTSPR